MEGVTEVVVLEDAVAAAVEGFVEAEAEEEWVVIITEVETVAVTKKWRWRTVVRVMEMATIRTTLNMESPIGAEEDLPEEGAEADLEDVLIDTLAILKYVYIFNSDDF